MNSKEDFWENGQLQILSPATTILIWFGLSKNWERLFSNRITSPSHYSNLHGNSWSFDNGQLTQACPIESFVSSSGLELRRSPCSSSMGVLKCEICKPPFPKQGESGYSEKAAEPWREVERRYRPRKRNLMSSNPCFQFSLEPSCIPAILWLSLRKRKLTPDTQQVAWHPQGTWNRWPCSAVERKQLHRTSTAEKPLCDSDGSRQTQKHRKKHECCPSHKITTTTHPG